MFTSYADYRPLLKSTISEKKARFGRAYTFSEMASKCRVQKTYLSRVLGGDGHLSSDQLYLACQYLHLAGDERQFVFALHELQRSEIPERRGELSQEIERIRARLQKTDPYLSIEATNVASDALSLYYLDPLLQQLHMFMTIDRYAKAPLALAVRLGVSESQVLQGLATLQRLKLIESKQGRFTVSRKALHLSSDSSLYVPWRTNIRVKSLTKLQSGGDDVYGFSALFSATLDVRRKIQDGFLKFLKNAEKLARYAKSEEVYQMNFDLFGW